MLYIIGLGLGDVKDITVKGLEIVRKCDKVLILHHDTFTITQLQHSYHSTYLQSV